MKLIAMPIEVIAWCDQQGQIKPLKFKYRDDRVDKVIKIDRVLKIEKTRRAGEDAYIFTCESQLKQRLRVYELRYTLSSCQWVLYKV